MSIFLAINNNNREAKKGTLIKIFFCVKYYLYQITSLEAAQKRGFRKIDQLSEVNKKMKN